MKFIFLVFSSAFLISLILTPLFRRIALAAGLVSRSHPPRKDTRCLPYLGGVSIYLSCAGAAAFAASFKIGLTPELAGILIGATVVFLLGVYDDFRELSPMAKIVGQLIAALILILFGVKIQIGFLPGAINILLTIFWVLLICNAFNLLDILDGLAGGLAVIASLTFLAISALTQDLVVATLMAAVAGGSAAFLRYNFPPAKVLMGDAGSQFLGFVLASAAIAISYAPFEPTIALLTPVVVVGLPLYDVLFVALMRVKDKKSIFKKSNDHFALRLLSSGCGYRKAVLIMYSFGAFFGLNAIVISRVSNEAGFVILFLVVLVLITFGKKLSIMKVE